MYTVFSPYTKLADVATPDQTLPRLFNELVDSFLNKPGPVLEKTIMEQLTVWKENHDRFLVTLQNSPVLAEAENLSENLAAIASAGLNAMQLIHENKKAGQEWMQQQQILLKKATEQGGRCDLQVVVPIGKIINAVKQ
jgi:hexosaminidase